MMYCGVLWGLFNDTGWAMTLDHEHHIFPFWLSVIHAQKHAEQYWPQYSPRPIQSHDFQSTLLPTLTRLNVIPTLFTHGEGKFKFNSPMMKYFFFNAPIKHTHLVCKT